MSEARSPSNTKSGSVVVSSVYIGIAEAREYADIDSSNSNRRMRVTLGQCGTSSVLRMLQLFQLDLSVLVPNTAGY